MRFKPYPKYKPSDVEWLGEVPEGWNILALKYIVSMRSGEQITADSIEGNGAFPVYGGNGLRGYTSNFTHDGFYALIGRQGALCGNINYASGKFWASEHAVVVSPTIPCSTRWIGELLRSMDLGQYSITAAQPGLSVDAISKLRIPFASLNEQIQIATFLDRETAKIDTLIAKQEKLIELLKEKRQAVISHAVTKGLNSNAPMKESGVEWLGEVPAHWMPRRLAVLFRQEKRQNYPDREVLSVYRDYGVVLKNSRQDNMNKTPDDITLYQLVNKDDLVVNKMKAWQGSLGISSFEGITSPDYIVFSPRHREHAGFLHLLLRCQRMVSVYRSISNGIRPAQWRLEPKSFLNLLVFLPPLQEQLELVKFVEEQVTRFDVLTAKAEQAIALQRERRTALISAAVTGKIDVRNEASERKAA